MVASAGAYLLSTPVELGPNYKWIKDPRLRFVAGPATVKDLSPAVDVGSLANGIVEIAVIVFVLDLALLTITAKQRLLHVEFLLFYRGKVAIQERLLQPALTPFCPAA